MGCAIFVDLLLPCAIFSKVMQSDEIDILCAMNSLLRTVQETEKLSSKPLSAWPTYVATRKKFTEEGGIKYYQSQEVRQVSVAETFFSSHCDEYCGRIIRCIQSRLAWSDLQLMKDVVFFLSPHGWEKVIQDLASQNSLNGMEPVSHLVQRFKTPLELAGADIEEINSEFQEMINYASCYISLSTLDYSSVWWRLFHAPMCSDWPNVLILAQLLFSLPASNGKVERVFSTLNTIKVLC